MDLSNQTLGRVARRHRGRHRRRVEFVIAALVVLTVHPSTAPARVEPLVVIERQIHKANMLIVLDTSGSMTGVPGGQFANSTECGVDCDNGANCRQGGVMGVCAARTSRTCLSDDDCQHGYCQKDGVTICAANSDCPQDVATCSYTGGTCSQNSDCPAQTGTCSLSAGTCTTNANCPAAGNCSNSGAVCLNPGGACPVSGRCSLSSATVCTQTSDCPPASSTGTCSQGNTPHGGCTADDDCPAVSQCQYTGESCRRASDCPTPTSGTCSFTGATCRKNKDCWSWESCTFLANPCVGVATSCVLPQDVCNPATNNCVAAANTCNAPSNTCVVPPVNACIQPASSSDTCVPSPQGTPGPIRMCLIAQTVCKKDSDCSTSGDSCGPATSRAIIAKRAIANVVASSSSMVNFGLMTFWQGDYFPYYKSTTGSGGTVTQFYPEHRLLGAHCLDKNGHGGAIGAGPSQSCRLDGITMQLRSAADSRYRVRVGWGTWVDVDADWCGDWCNLPGALGFGNYQGSYYQYTAPGTNSTTLLVQPTYTGKYITVNGNNYSYYQPLTNYYNGGEAPPIDTPNCDNTCTAQCGGRWDTQLAPFLDTTDDAAKAQAASDAIRARMEPASNGGLITYWSTPTGCTLSNAGAPNPNASAYHYMQAVKTGNSALGVVADHLACRDNFVLLVTDGAANGPGDDNCDANACAASNPRSAGCTCRAVLAAYDMRINLGVRTFVVGFSGDVSAGSPRTINDNIARAGGTDADRDGVAPFAFLAQNEQELLRALQLAIFDAIRGSYSTAPTSTSAGTQQVNTVAEGRYALDSRVDFPEWKGHLLAYDLSGSTPVLAWDAAAKLDSTNWWERRIYTWNGTTMVKIDVDPSSKAVRNKATLATLGLGSTADEAESVARWLLGDPAAGNPARLGALINSTPIDVASPGDLPYPGGHEFYVRYASRPHLVYVGASDGMLHAFFLEATKVGTTTYPAGNEAFAILPPNMLSMVRKLYGQGGQLPDPYKHIYGIANSPKAKSLCVQGCTDASTAVWKTMLIMPEGYGGTETFAIDVTAPFATNGLADPPVNLMWSTDAGSSKATYDSALGKTISLPAFLLNKTATNDDYRVIFASGYPSDSTNTTQGRSLLLASAATGAVSANLSLTPDTNCTQAYTALTDVATARDFAQGQSQRLLAAFFGDTAGRLWRYQLGTGLTLDTDFGCNYPLHFAPTTIQLDRDVYTPAHAREIYLVQVTNSNIDLETDSLPASRMVFMKRVADVDPSTGTVTGMHADTRFGTNGTLTLQVGSGTQICGVTTTDSHGTVTCQTPMPTTARPASTPLGILRKDGEGFQVFTMWYVPAPDGCTKGATYLTIHQLIAGTVTQRLGVVAAHEPVTSPLILHGRIYVFGAAGAIDITNMVPDAVAPGRAVPSVTKDTVYSRFNWTEVL